MQTDDFARVTRRSGYAGGSRVYPSSLTGSLSTSNQTILNLPPTFRQYIVFLVVEYYLRCLTEVGWGYG